MTEAKLKLDRERILAFRRRTGGLVQRMPAGRRSIRLAAWAGLQDSMPRAALLSLHARVDGIGPSAWEDPSLVQLWGPRYQAYVVAERDLAIFTLGRLPDQPRPRRVAEDLAARMRAVTGDAPTLHADVAAALGEPHNRLRYAAPTGTVLIRWDGARQPTIRTRRPPSMDPGAARLELARRYLHVFGPATPDAFAGWAGIPARAGLSAFEGLRRSVVPVRTPIGDAWILARDEPEVRAARGPEAPARLLPSGDAYSLLQGPDRELLVPEAGRRRELWTSRVWPGAVLADGQLSGTWRRAGATVTVRQWGRLARSSRDAIEAEAESLPLPGVEGIVVRWER